MGPKLQRIDEDTISAECYRCREVYIIAVSVNDMKSWENGMLIQTAFPNLTPWERELMISGLCDGCWADIFKDVN